MDSPGLCDAACGYTKVKAIIPPSPITIIHNNKLSVRPTCCEAVFPPFLSRNCSRLRDGRWTFHLPSPKRIISAKPKDIQTRAVHRGRGRHSENDTESDSTYSKCAWQHVAKLFDFCFVSHAIIFWLWCGEGLFGQSREICGCVCVCDSSWNDDEPVCIIVSVDFVELSIGEPRMLLFLHIFSYGWMINSIFRWNNSEGKNSKMCNHLCAVGLRTKLWLHADIHTKNRMHSPRQRNDSFSWLPIHTIHISLGALMVYFHSTHSSWVLLSAVRCVNSGTAFCLSCFVHS